MQRHAVAIDFDGTLAITDYPIIVEPIPEAVKFVKACHAADVAVILWTCRTDEHLDMALEWCQQQGLWFDAVNENLGEWTEEYSVLFPDVEPDCRKICADIYIDDRNMGGTDWAKAWEWLKIVSPNWG